MRAAEYAKRTNRSRQLITRYCKKGGILEKAVTSRNPLDINAEFDPTKADSADLLSSRQSERQMSALRGIA